MGFISLPLSRVAGASHKVQQVLTSAVSGLASASSRSALLALPRPSLPWALHICFLDNPIFFCGFAKHPHSFHLFQNTGLCATIKANMYMYDILENLIKPLMDPRWQTSRLPADDLTFRLRGCYHVILRLSPGHLMQVLRLCIPQIGPICFPSLKQC